MEDTESLRMDLTCHLPHRMAYQGSKNHPPWVATITPDPAGVDHKRKSY